MADEHQDGRILRFPEHPEEIPVGDERPEIKYRPDEWKRCDHKKLLEYSRKDRTVHCGTCGLQLDLFDVFLILAGWHWDRDSRVEFAREFERKEAERREKARLRRSGIKGVRGG